MTYLGCEGRANIFGRCCGTARVGAGHPAHVARPSRAAARERPRAEVAVVDSEFKFDRLDRVLVDRAKEARERCVSCLSLI
jgi:hypothetical protein